MMGCLASKETEQEQQQQVFSWDREDRPDPKDFMIAEQTKGVHGKMPGQVKGQQFLVENCCDCVIFIFDHSAMVTVDNCERCKIFFGPIKGSLFLRNCKDLQIVAACQQFRSRDCRKIDVFLHCATQPIVESSASMKFSCFQFYYPELQTQFEEASLSVYNNQWSNIHDFTPVPEESNWSLLAESLSVIDLLPLPEVEPFSTIQLDISQSKSIVPLSRGTRPKFNSESCLVSFFGNQRKGSRKFLDAIIADKECHLVQSKEMPMNIEDIQRIFRDEKYNQFAQQGTVVGLEIGGDDVISKCLDTMNELSLDQDQVYLSPDQETAKRDVDAFYVFVEMTMS